MFWIDEVFFPREDQEVVALKVSELLICSDSDDTSASKAMSDTCVFSEMVDDTSLGVSWKVVAANP